MSARSMAHAANVSENVTFDSNRDSTMIEHRDGGLIAAAQRRSRRMNTVAVHELPRAAFTLLHPRRTTWPSSVCLRSGAYDHQRREQRAMLSLANMNVK